VLLGGFLLCVKVCCCTPCWCFGDWTFSLSWCLQSSEPPSKAICKLIMVMGKSVCLLFSVSWLHPIKRSFLELSVHLPAKCSPGKPRLSYFVLCRQLGTKCTDALLGDFLLWMYSYLLIFSWAFQKNHLFCWICHPAYGFLSVNYESNESN